MLCAWYAELGGSVAFVLPCRCHEIFIFLTTASHFRQSKERDTYGRDHTYHPPNNETLF